MLSLCSIRFGGGGEYPFHDHVCELLFTTQLDSLDQVNNLTLLMKFLCFMTINYDSNLDVVNRVERNKKSIYMNK